MKAIPVTHRATRLARQLTLTLPVLALLAAGCSGQQTPIATATPTAETVAQPPAGAVVASAVVVPALDAELGFVIAGTVKEIAVREGDRVQAGQTLMLLNAPELEYAVIQAEAAARAAAFEYQYWIPARLDRPPERRQLAEQELRKVERSLDVARAAAYQAVLSAPFDGTVVSIDATPGELVGPAQVVLTLASLDRLQIETTDLSERDVTRLQPGQSATISVEALDQEFPGRVVAIAPKSDTVGGDVVYRVTLELEAQPADLLWGMSAEIQIDAQ